MTGPYSPLSALLLWPFQEHISCLRRAPANSIVLMVLWHQQS